MTSLALFLTVIALLDGIAGSTETSPTHRTYWASIAVLAVLAAAMTHLVYVSWTATLLTLLALSLGSALWANLRTDIGSSRSGWLAITALATCLAIAAFVVPAIGTGTPEPSKQLYMPITAYLATLPWRQLETVDPEHILLTLGALLFLGPTANAIVKTVMAQIRGVDSDASEQQLKGGRYIGPLERWLIFGLALAGQPTAAALVISAKSIIRFPELQSKAERPETAGLRSPDSEEPLPQSIDELTEYFLIGSLLSWLLALVAALPLAMKSNTL